MLSSDVREEVRGAAIGVWETVEMWVPVKEVAPGAVNLMEKIHKICQLKHYLGSRIILCVVSLLAGQFYPLNTASTRAGF